MDEQKRGLLFGEERRAELALIGITVIWWLTFTFTKKSLAELQPFVFLAWRFWLAFGRYVWTAASCDLIVVGGGGIFQDVFYSFLSFTCFHFQIDKRQLHIFINIEFVDQVKTLEYEPDISFSENCPVAFLQVCHLSTIKNITS